jgi:leucine dehydrogenase
VIEFPAHLAAPFCKPMQIREIPVPGYERVAAAHDPASGLRAIISVHDRTLGPALGGMRMWKYANEDEALRDVLRLSRGMTYKSAIARTGLGGGKSVILGDARQDKSPKLFEAMGAFIESFEGGYVTAEDVGTTVADLAIVRRKTKHVTGLSREEGGSGNPSPYTAKGCFVGVRAVLEEKFRVSEVKGLTFAIQGVGAVGGSFARMLAEAGAKLIVSDLHQEKAEALSKELGVKAVPYGEVLFQECDVLCPSALGGVFDDTTVPRLRCQAIAGCSNNQLLEPRHGDMLQERGILYAPDYVINAGGIINVGCEFLPGGYDEAESLRRIDRIYPNLKEVFEVSKRDQIPPHLAADRRAQEILTAARKKS